MLLRLSSTFVAIICLAGVASQPVLAENFHLNDIEFIFGKSITTTSNFNAISILSNQEMIEIDAEGLIKTFKRVGEAWKTGRTLSRPEAERRVRKGGDVWVERRADAVGLARGASDGRGKIVRERHDNRGTGHSHIHPFPRENRGHVVYGFPKPK